MNVKHLRAKYQIEQYPVVFTFPEQVLYEPRVRVEVVSGVDPAPETFAGLPIVDGNLVAVLVAGGVPGVIYRIICAADLADEIVELEGLLAVKDTAANTPEGTSALPLTLAVTTPPYPAFVLDELIVSAIGLNGLIIPFPIDNLDISCYALSGIHRDLINIYVCPPEELAISCYAINGTHRVPVVSYVCPPEELAISCYALNGTHKNVVIVYSNYPPEELDISCYALNGTHAAL